MKSSSVNVLYSLYKKTSRGRKVKFTKLLLLAISAGLVEIISIGALFPFLALLVNPGKISNIAPLSWVFSLFNIDVNITTIKLTILLSAIIIVSGIVRFLLINATIKFNFYLAHELGVKIYKNILYEGINTHYDRNSSEILSIMNKLEHLVWATLGSIQFISGLIMALFICTFLILFKVEFFLPLIATIVFFYGLFFLIFRKKLVEGGEVMSASSNKRAQFLQEGLNSIHDILSSHSQRMFLDKFQKVDLKFRNAQIVNQIIGPAPRVLMEVLVMLLIVSLTYISIGESDIYVAIPTLGVIIVGMQRLLPLIQQVYHGWTQFNGNQQIFIDINKLITTKANHLAVRREVGFDQYIEFREIYYKYKRHLPMVINNMNFKIDKGSKVGFIGSTGSGKSTVVDVLLGLISPSKGCLLVDNICLNKEYYQSWQERVAYVPQSIYLLDASYAENIAFGILPCEINFSRVKLAAEIAQISDIIENSVNNYNALIGENGIFLSGGQRQRIGIARALYRQSDVLILDEATSSLDIKIEKQIMENLSKIHDITIIIIAHRYHTLQGCDWVYEINKGSIERKITPEALLAS